MIVVQPDGKILIGGDFTTVSPNGGPAVTRNRIARLNSDGTLDNAFNPNASSSVRAIAVQADGQILVGGEFLAFFGAITIGGQSKSGIARVNATTGLADPSFPDAVGQVFSLLLQPDGQILVGGNFSAIGGQPRNRIARLNPDGTADSFNPNANDAVYAMAVQADGKVLAGGQFFGANSIGGQTRNYVARLDATTGAADSFNPNASGIDPFVYAITVQADGQILAGGAFNNIGGQPRNRIARIDAVTGRADTFDPNATGTIHSIVVQADGRILAGGAFGSIGGQVRHRLAWLDESTGWADWFNPGASNTDYAIAIQPNGGILAGGDFVSVAPGCEAAVTRNRIARFQPGPLQWVVSNNNDSGAGSLRDVIANICAGSTITFAPNVTGTINLTSGELLLGKNLFINGPGANLLRIQRGASASNFRIFNIASNTVAVAISGLTISNGNAAGFSFGGGISSAGILALSNAAISGNFAAFGGGGIRNDGGTLTLADCTISDNSTNIGGAGILNSGTATISNSTISGNNAMGGNGGGIVSTVALNLTNCTISSNSATGNGGGIHNSGGTVTSRSTIFALNTSPNGPDFSGAATSTGFNLIGNNSGSSITPTTGDQIGTAGSPIDPLLGPLQDNGGPTFTRALLAGSPAIDKGTRNGLQGILTTDQRGAGFSRVADYSTIANASTENGADIGAVEFWMLEITSITRFADGHVLLEGGIL